MKATHLAETTGGLAMTWLAEAAQAKRAAICGSVMMKEQKNIYNQFIWMYPDLTFTYYNKRHLFRMGGEDKAIGVSTGNSSDWNRDSSAARSASVTSLADT